MAPDVNLKSDKKQPAQEERMYKSDHNLTVRYPSFPK